MEKQKFYGWKLVGVLWIVYFVNMGFPLYGGSVINAVMLNEIAMDRAVFGLAYTLLNFFIGVPSMLVAASITKMGVKRTFLIGSILIVLGSLWMAFVASEPWHYVVGFGVVISAGIGFSTIVCITATLTRWFVRFRGRAMGIVLAASGFAGLVGAPLMNRIVAAYNGDWRTAWLYVAAIVLAAGIMAQIFVKEKPSDLGQIPDGIKPENDSNLNKKDESAEWTPKAAYKTLAFKLLVFAAVAAQVPMFFFTAHWVLFLRGIGITPENAALALGLYTMGGIGGRLIGGWLLDRIQPRLAYMMGLSCYVIGAVVALNLTGETLVLAYITGIIFGMGLGWSLVSVYAVTASYYGMKAYPQLNGVVLSLSALIGSPTGLLGGMIFDRYGSYNPAYIFLIILVLLGIVSVYFAKKPVMSQISTSGSDLSKSS